MLPVAGSMNRRHPRPKWPAEDDGLRASSHRDLAARQFAASRSACAQRRRMGSAVFGPRLLALKPYTLAFEHFGRDCRQNLDAGWPENGSVIGCDDTVDGTGQRALARRVDRREKWPGHRAA